MYNYNILGICVCASHHSFAHLTVVEVFLCPNEHKSYDDGAEASGGVP